MSVLYTDIATAAGRPASSFSEQQVEQLNWWIKVAQTKIRNHFRKLRIPYEDLDPETVKVVVVEAVTRKVLNPKGKQNERIDDYSYGLNPEEATSRIHITEEEWQDLMPEAPPAGAFMIRTDLGTGHRRDPYAWGW